MAEVSYVRRLVKHFGQFLGGNFIALAFGLITFPLLTRLLSQEQYGVLSIINATAALAVAVAKGGISDAIIRFYRDHAVEPHALRTFTSTVIMRAITFAVLAALLYLALLPFLLHLLGIDPRYRMAFVVMGVYLLLRPMDVALLNFARAVGSVGFFNILNVLTRVVSVLVSLGLLLLVSKTLTAFAFGPACAEIFAVSVAAVWLLRTHSLSPSAVSSELAWKLTAFGLPLLVTELGYLLLLSADRYILAAIRGEAEVGIYSVGYNLPTYLNDLVMFSISYAVVPIYNELYAREGLEPTRAFLEKSLRYFCAGVIPMCFGYAAVARDAIVILASEKYESAAQFSPIILAGLVLLGVNYILYAGLYIQKRTRQISAAMLVAVVINLILDLVLIPRYGAAGAALAAFSSCFASMVLTATMSFRYLRLRIPVATIAYYGAISLVMYVGLGTIDTGYAVRDLLIKLFAGGVWVVAAALLKERELRTGLRRLLAI